MGSIKLIAHHNSTEMRSNLLTIFHLILIWDAEHFVEFLYEHINVFWLWIEIFCVPGVASRQTTTTAAVVAPSDVVRAATTVSLERDHHHFASVAHAAWAMNATAHAPRLYDYCFWVT